MSDILKHSFSHVKNKEWINIWFRQYLKFHTTLSKYDSVLIQAFIKARVDEVDLDPRKIITTLEPFCTNPPSIIITIELFQCIKLMNDNLFKRIIIRNTASVSNRTLYSFLSGFSKFVIIQRALENGGEKSSNVTNVFITVDEPPIALFTINGHTVQIEHVQ